jgi:predicted ribosome quality control (RQC) complex YloA/Tae2 family protein
MPFDTLTMAAVADEIRDAAHGGQIQRIIQPSAPTVSLAIYAGGALHWLVLSADARYCRVHLAFERLAKGFATPSSFVMLLRKHLEGSRLVDVQQQPYERVLRLTIGASEHRVTLVAEIMGKHSNIVLLDTDETILGALKIIPPRQSRVRPIVPGGRYTPPPPRPRDKELFVPGERVDPFTSSHLFVELLSRVPARTPVIKALLGVLAGAGPFLAQEVAVRAHVNPNTAMLDVPLDGVRAGGADLYRLYRSRAWEPTAFLDRRGRPDFAPFVPVQAPDSVRMPSMSAAVEASLGQDESRDALGVTRKAILDRIERALGAAEHRVTSLCQGLEAAEDAETAMERGQLILAYQYLLSPRANRLEIPELDITIQLDPELTPSENAEKAFRRYRKLRDARSRIPDLLRRAETEVGRLQDLAAFVRLAESEGELRDLERAVDRPNGDRRPSATKREKSRGPARYQMDGYSLIVGRNARENEEVTFRLARRDDLWLHARQRTGAHVILHSVEDAPSDEVLEAAAGVAAYFSEGRNDTAVDVDVARVRDVRKIPGGPPGRVIYRGESTVRATPGMGEWKTERA